MNGDSGYTKLISRASKGDQVALDALLARYRPYLRLIAEQNLRPKFRSRFDGSDIVQQTCYEAFRAIESLRGSTEAEFNAWIKRILQNNVTNLLRDHTADKRDVRREQAMNSADSELSLNWLTVSPSGSRPESQAIKGEAALLLAQSMSELPEIQRTAVQMRYLEMYTLREIAEYLETSTSTAARLIDRGLQTLHDVLPDEVL